MRADGSTAGGLLGCPAKQARLKGELQRILVGPDYMDFGPMWDKKATIISRIMEWAHGATIRS